MESYWFVISCETQPNHYDIDILTFNYMPTRLMFCEIDHVGAKTYSLAEVVVATNNFKTMIGKGGFGPVYYGKLEDGQDVAIKELDVKSTQGPSEFFNEVCKSSQILLLFVMKLIQLGGENKNFNPFHYET
jgi:hypothetical protein